MGTSIRPMLLTAPASEKILVPVLLGVPMALNHSAPFWTMGATQAKVSTLLISVGLPHRPLSAG